ncbi:nuclear transport factor 2 family protein [Roseivirga sp.]|uniref:nuclear transport factor 2 family protein n=1 Tax=Roseivirga sp. TaxID=1964215 RepID=UPI003B8D93E5
MKRLSLLLIFAFFCIGLHGQDIRLPEKLVKNQLTAYNNKDIEKFLVNYSDSVKIYNHPNQLVMSGKAQMRAAYTPMFANSPELHCTIKNRVVLGNTVIDQEHVVFNKNRPAMEVFAMYKIRHGKIQEVFFIEPDKE